MAELGRHARGAVSGDLEEPAGTSDTADVALRVCNDIEQVAIEVVHVGDYVLLDTLARPVSARCVIKKYAKANERTARVVGWLLELSGGHVAWWPRGGLVRRRRISMLT